MCSKVTRWSDSGGVVAVARIAAASPRRSGGGGLRNIGGGYFCAEYTSGQAEARGVGRRAGQEMVGGRLKEQNSFFKYIYIYI